MVLETLKKGFRADSTVVAQLRSHQWSSDAQRKDLAEKFQAMVVLETINDRMKDFYDIWLLSQHVDIAGQTLAKAIQATFAERRSTIRTYSKSSRARLTA